jgi:hypothetical protein
METNVNLEAAVGVLGFLGSCALLLLLFLVALGALFRRRGARFKSALAALAGWLVLYLSLMLAFSFMSREKSLARGAEKYFCEIDCHLAYAVTGVLKAKELGPEGSRVKAQGLFYVVTVRTRFDEETTGRGRGDAPLTPNSRVVTVEDAQGRIYNPSPAGSSALELSLSEGTPISTPLRPGESYTTAFDLPENVEKPALLIREAELSTHLIIGHENSPLHQKVLLSLDETPPPVVKSDGLSRSLGSQFKNIVSAVLRRLKGYSHH